jgi:hypothetical protein
VPLLGFAEAGAGGHFDDRGYPGGKGWDEVGLPAVSDEHAYALEISGDAMKPAYRDGDVIVVSPGTAIRRGDRVVVKTTGGEVMVKELKRRTAKDAGAGIAQSRPGPTPRAGSQRGSNGSRGSCGRVSSPRRRREPKDQAQLPLRRRVAALRRCSSSSIFAFFRFGLLDLRFLRRIVAAQFIEHLADGELLISAILNSSAVQTARNREVTE